MTELHHLPLRGGLIGVEREALRCDSKAHLAQSPHPHSLGSALTHPRITIDYGEALLELVTRAQADVTRVYQELQNLHRFCAQHLPAGEMMWAGSMPCVLPAEDEIALGQFGTSNGGKLRHLYRQGLALRYGRFMQMIAGIHFNYSPPEALFEALAAQEKVANTQDFRNQRLMGMLRSVQRIAWLICYQFGASPAVDISFQPARQQLCQHDAQTLIWNKATTLRMSQLGYQNKVDFVVSLNDIESYTRDLISAVLTPAPRYEYLGWRNAEGDFQQISTHILQIENEYYSSIRPKQPQKQGEHPSMALRRRGIAYVELRVLDVNPYEPCGISLAQMRVLEALLLWALLNPIAPLNSQQWNEFNHNRLRVACCGLCPETELFDGGKTRLLRDWAKSIWAEILPVAEQLSAEHAAAVAACMESEPLAQRVHHDLKTQSHQEWALNLAQQHHQSLQEALPAAELKNLRAEVAQSHADFAAIEAQAADEIPFADYLSAYFAPLKAEK